MVSRGEYQCQNAKMTKNAKTDVCSCPVLTLNMKSSLSSRVALSLIADITLQKSLKLRFWNTRVTLGASGDIASSGMDMSSSSLMYPLCRLSRVRKRLYRHWISRLLNLPPQCSCTSSTSYCVRFRLDAVSPCGWVEREVGRSGGDGRGIGFCLP